MLLENYTGDSKVLKAIAHILNRKAPLPLDGDGDADFGTNGQVLTTDGHGNTYWSSGGGGGSYTAGDGIDITNNVISTDYFKVVNGELCQVYDDGQ